jgi:hypothetical protein
MAEKDKEAIVQECGDLLPDVGFFDAQVDFRTGKVSAFPFQNDLVGANVSWTKYLEGNDDLPGGPTPSGLNETSVSESWRGSDMAGIQARTPRRAMQDRCGWPGDMRAEAA